MSAGGCAACIVLTHGQFTSAKSHRIHPDLQYRLVYGAVEYLVVRERVPLLKQALWFLPSSLVLRFEYSLCISVNCCVAGLLHAVIDCSVWPAGSTRWA
jgi:hypothetical protein